MNKPKRWRVVLTRDVTMSAFLDIEAESAEEANDKALDMALDGNQILPWDLDDCANSQPYLSDPDGTEEVEQ